MPAELLMMTALLWGATTQRPIDFDTDIQPVLTHAGCNSGQCHGSAAGRGGFRLSLWGSRPAEDFQAITRQLEGRRINLHEPAASLLLWKASETVTHGGGTRLPAESEGYLRLLEWIEQGAERRQVRELHHLDVTPTRAIVPAGDSTTVRVEAIYEGGQREDVTRWAVLTAMDPTVATWDAANHRLTMLRRGRVVVTARYLDQVVPIQLLAPLSDEQADHSSASGGTFIDQYVCQQAGTLGLPLSPPAHDGTFLRRLYLDLTGQLPSPDQLQEFLSDRGLDKRQRVIDRLLASPEFTCYWSTKLAGWLRVGRSEQADPAMEVLEQWICDQLAQGNSWDVIAAELLLAEGDTQSYGPANFYRITADARNHAEYVSEVFLGVRLACANCHDHPLDRWTQDDYHGLAAIFAGIRRGPVVEVREGSVTHPRTGEPAQQRLPGERFLAADEDGRLALATWLRDKDNPYFARAMVNRLWHSMMGRGLVEPIDDMSETNPATHPDLLRQLADDFVTHQYDIRHTLRLVAASDTYQRSSEALEDNRLDREFYSHALTRPLEAHVLAAAMARVTGVPAHSAAVPGRASPRTDVAARAAGERLTCIRDGASGTDVSGSLALKLYLLNGPLLNVKVESEDGYLQRWLAEGVAEDVIIERFFQLALSRSPQPHERAYWNEQLAQAAPGEEGRQLLEDFLWSLLSSRQFTTNH